MSGPTPTLSLPRDIWELMTTTVVWEAFLGFDGHAEPSYASPIYVTCWQESHGLTGGGLEVYRRADGTVVEPQWDLLFDGDDANVQNFQLYDRFLPGGIGTDPAQKLQAVRLATFLGPNFDNTNPWIVLITL